MDLKELNIEGLSDELKQEARACTSTAELLALAKREGIKLTEDQMDAVSGGGTWSTCYQDYDVDCNFYH